MKKIKIYLYEELSLDAQKQAVKSYRETTGAKVIEALRSTAREKLDRFSKHLHFQYHFVYWNIELNKYFTIKYLKGGVWKEETFLCKRKPAQFKWSSEDVVEYLNMLMQVFRAKHIKKPIKDIYALVIREALAALREYIEHLNSDIQIVNCIIDREYYFYENGDICHRI